MSQSVNVPLDVTFEIFTGASNCEPKRRAEMPFIEPIDANALVEAITYSPSSGFSNMR